MTENHLRFVIGRHRAIACKRLRFVYTFTELNDRRIPNWDIFLMWPWTLTYFALQTLHRQGRRDEPASQIFMSKVDHIIRKLLYVQDALPVALKWLEAIMIIIIIVLFDAVEQVLSATFW